MKASSSFGRWLTESHSQQLGALGMLLSFLCFRCICMYMYFCWRVLPVSRFCERVCVPAGSDSKHTNLFNSLGAWATDGALCCSWSFQPLKQAPGLQPRLRPKPSFHSPHQPSCLFSEALEETLDEAYQIQTVARLCYFTHRPLLNWASFSVIVFFLAW